MKKKIQFGWKNWLQASPASLLKRYAILHEKSNLVFKALQAKEAPNEQVGKLVTLLHKKISLVLKLANNSDHFAKELIEELATCLNKQIELATQMSNHIASGNDPTKKNILALVALNEEETTLLEKLQKSIPTSQVKKVAA